MNVEKREREIARRQLLDNKGNPIALVLYEPLLDSTRAAESWLCKTEIVTNQGTTSFNCVGADALQALALGLTSLRHGVKQLGMILSWLGMQGQTGLPVVVQEVDEDFQNLMESLLNAELSRQALWQREIRSRQPSAP